MAHERRQRSARELQRPVWSLAGLIDQGFSCWRVRRHFGWHGWFGVKGGVRAAGG